jgi:hypothetical protein
MRQGVIRTPAQWGERVRAASAYAGPRPPVSVWQGLADPVVNPVNADELIKQWLDVMGLDGSPPLIEATDGAERHLWRDQNGRPLLTLYRIPDFGHAVPITPHAALPAARIGQAGASRFVHPGPISATWRIAQDWGLTTNPVAQPSLADKEAGAAAPACSLWHHLPGARQIEALAGTMAGADTPLGRFLRERGLNPPRHTPEHE